MTCAGVVSTLPTSRTSAGHPVRAWPPCSSAAHCAPAGGFVATEKQAVVL